MGWKTDWLYQKILKEFSTHFDNAYARDPEAHPQIKGPLPEEVIAYEYPRFEIVPRSYGGNDYVMHGAPVRFLRYAGEGWEELRSVEPIVYPKRPTGMYHQRAECAFVISPDRKTVVIQYMFGPRYGRHDVYTVSGQNRSARFGPCAGAMGWTS